MASSNFLSLLALVSSSPYSMTAIAASMHSQSLSVQATSTSPGRASFSFLPTTNFPPHRSFRESVRVSRSIDIPTRRFPPRATRTDDDDDDDDPPAGTTRQELLQTLDSKFHYDGRISSKLSPLSSSDDVPHRCALVTILGRPNMGKSTLLNALLSDDLSIATRRPQTTRHAILGVLTSERTQLCFTDTPGIIETTAYRLQDEMMEAVRGAARDGDAFLVVTDAGSRDDDDDDDDPYLGLGEEMATKLRRYRKPILVCVNKIDLASDDGDGGGGYTPPRAARTIRKWRTLFPRAFAVLPVCAARGPNDAGVVALRSILTANDPGADVPAAIRGLGRPVPGMFRGDEETVVTNEEAREILPEGPPLYGEDFLTDRTDRFCASELIRETLFERLGKELPYCCEVRIETFDESRRYLEDEEEDGGSGGGHDDKRRRNKSMIRIGAIILVERESQKGIVVGKGGKQIKEVGMDARKKLQKFFGVKIFLDLRVKVDKNWRNNVEKLKQYGYM